MVPFAPSVAFIAHALHVEYVEGLEDLVWEHLYSRWGHLWGHICP
jgi:hypothetical protein